MSRVFSSSLYYPTSSNPLDYSCYLTSLFSGSFSKSIRIIHSFLYQRAFLKYFYFPHSLNVAVCVYEGKVFFLFTLLQDHISGFRAQFLKDKMKTGGSCVAEILQSFALLVTLISWQSLLSPWHLISGKDGIQGYY